MLNSWGQSLGLLVLRVSFGAMMLVGHGIPKLLSFSDLSKSFPDPIGVGSFVSLCLVLFAEFFCSVLLILGLGTRLATIPLIVTMLVAILVAHKNDPWTGKELATAYLAAYVTLLIAGSGGFGLDRFLRLSRRTKATSK